MHTSSPSQTQGLFDRHDQEKLFPALLLIRSNALVRRISRWTFVALALSILAMIFVPWQQTSKASGRVIAFDPQERPQQVKSTAKGIVVNIMQDLREGTFVTTEDVIFEIEPLAKDAQSQMEDQVRQQKLKLETAENKLELAKQSVDLQKLAGDAIIQSAVESVEAAKAKVSQSKEKVEGYDASVERTRLDYDRSAKLLPDGLRSQKEYIKDKENYLKAVADFEEGEAAVLEAVKNLAAKDQDLIGKTKEVEVKNRDAEGKVQEALAEIASVKKSLSETKQKLDEFGDRLKVKPPCDGYIHEIFSYTGSAVVKEGDSLFTVVPDTKELAVELYARGNDVPLFRINDEVRLTFEGFPAIQFIGWPSAGRGTFGGRIALINPTDDGQGDFRIVIQPDKDQEPWPKNRSLRQGAQANGWVLLSTEEGKLSQVPLGYELWRQLNGFPAVVSKKPPEDGKESKDEKIKKPKLGK